MFCCSTCICQNDSVLGVTTWWSLMYWSMQLRCQSAFGCEKNCETATITCMWFQALQFCQLWGTWRNVYAREIKSLTYYTFWWCECVLLVSSTARQTARAPMYLASILEQTVQEAKWQFIFHPSGFYQSFYHSLSNVCRCRFILTGFSTAKIENCHVLCLAYVSSWIVLLAEGSADPTAHATWWSLVTSKCLWNPVKRQRSHSSSTFYWYSHLFPIIQNRE